jgi:hypothetical protein
MTLVVIPNIPIRSPAAKATGHRKNCRVPQAAKYYKLLPIAFSCYARLSSVVILKHE